MGDAYEIICRMIDICRSNLFFKFTMLILFNNEYKLARCVFTFFLFELILPICQLIRSTWLILPIDSYRKFVVISGVGVFFLSVKIQRRFCQSLLLSTIY